INRMRALDRPSPGESRGGTVHGCLPEPGPLGSMTRSNQSGAASQSGRSVLERARPAGLKRAREERHMSRLPGRLAAVVALGVALFPMDAGADVVAKNVTAIFRNVSTENAFDFIMRVDGGIRSSLTDMTINPVSNKFNDFQIFTSF